MSSLYIHSFSFRRQQEILYENLLFRIRDQNKKITEFCLKTKKPTTCYIRLYMYVYNFLDHVQLFHLVMFTF